MKNKDKFTRNLIWTIISFQTIFTAIMLIVQVLRIYLGRVEGEDTFSREKVGAYLLQILVVLILWVLVVIVGVVMSYIKKIDDPNKSKNSNIRKLKTITCILPYDKIEENDEDYKELINLEKQRKIAYAIFAIVACSLSIFPFMYLFNKNHFIANGHATSQVIDMMLHILPFVVLGLLALIGTMIYESYNANNAIIVAKRLLAKYKKGDINYTKETKKKTQILWAIRGFILLVAVIFIITGIINGGPSGVYMKAAKICTECVGLG